MAKPKLKRVKSFSDIKIKRVEKFDFWKDNKLDQHFQLSPEELFAKFKAWLPQQSQDWLEYYSSERVIRGFITSANATSTGLDSVFDEGQWEQISEILQPVYLDHTYPEKK